MELATFTRDQAYKDLIDSLGERQLDVFDAILAHPHGISNLEIALYLRLPINSITPRVYELRDRKLVAPGIKKKCPITGRLVQTWIENKQRITNENLQV